MYRPSSIASKMKHTVQCAGFIVHNNISSVMYTVCYMYIYIHHLVCIICYTTYMFQDTSAVHVVRYNFSRTTRATCHVPYIVEHTYIPRRPQPEGGGAPEGAGKAPDLCEGRHLCGIH